jgi:nitrate reductase assembly molybdenum cofactor insertion protein NarJ
MSTSCVLAPAALDHLRLATEWRLLALAFECPGGTWQAQMDELRGEVEDADLRQLPDCARQEAAPELYHTTFGPGGPAAPREVSYVRSIQPGQLIADIQAFYDAFAYCPAIDEPPDHVAVELGFVSYLHLKAAYAISCGDDEHSATAIDAASRFTEYHLSGVAVPLAKLLVTSEVRYLSLAATAMLRRLAHGVHVP